MALDVTIDARQEAGGGSDRQDFASRWRRHSLRLAATDLVAIVVAAAVGLGVNLDRLAWDPTRYASAFGLGVTVALVLGWNAALITTKTRDRRIAGAGPQEYSRVAHATWITFAVLAILSYVFKLSPARSSVAVAFPLGLLLLFIGRNVWRRRLHKERARGESLASVLVAGHAQSVRDLILRLQRRPEFGYRPVAACLPIGEIPDQGEICGVPVVGTLGETAFAAAEYDADVVAVTGSDSGTAEFVRRLGWALSPHRIDLVIASSLTDVAGPRIIVTPVDGARLVHVDAPEFTGRKYVVKFLFDWITAALLVLLLAPVLIGVAIAVKATSSGPVIYRQRRIGRDGVPFTMFKFRSMVNGAHGQVAALATANEGNGLLFKMRDDPRITRVGKVIRRTSLDELPQLFNVLQGDMSLVGPRPPLPEEVEKYDAKISRRLLVKPGITGLWQVNGRSDLPLDESIRLDLNYVENWSVLGDLMILTRTLRAVTRGAGAY